MSTVLAPAWAFSDQLSKDKVAQDDTLPSLPRVACLLDGYEKEVRGGHGVMTAAECLYFSLLEFQRRLDLLEIHELALRTARSEPSSGDKWREELARKKVEASGALVERAKHYTIGERSAQTGLLQVAAGVAEKTLLLQRFTEKLEDEYETAAKQISASIEALAGEKQEIFDSYLKELNRSSSFWESEIESTFAEWVDASKHLHQGGERQSCVWDELTMELAQVFAWVHMREFSVSEPPALGLRYFVISSRKVQEERADQILVEVCARLLEIELEQSLHGLHCLRRRALLRQALAAARAMYSLPRIAQHLLRNTDFGCLVDRASVPVMEEGSEPWVAWLIEILGEFLMFLAVTCARSDQAIDVGLLRRNSSAAWSIIKQGVFLYTDDAREGRTPLHEAMLHQNHWLVGQLVHAKADPSVCDKRANSALSLALSDLSCTNDVIQLLAAAQDDSDDDS
eukprot:TRINITY_DN26945_c0_g1_i2.p1 TRINITY_DN26945_c0_g1~~TRINITY_DN26945_c0_g1_i2.p1  ORF type:complete len:456 (-),score=63.83 TRINITY_DN26945_c0_g1_i2:133-1500(-)